MALEKFTGNQDDDIEVDEDGENRYVSKYTRNEDIAMDMCENLENEMNQMFKDLDDMQK